MLGALNHTSNSSSRSLMWSIMRIGADAQVAEDLAHDGAPRIADGGPSHRSSRRANCAVSEIRDE